MQLVCASCGVIIGESVEDISAQITCIPCLRERLFFRRVFTEGWDRNKIISMSAEHDCQYMRREGESGGHMWKIVALYQDVSEG